MTDAPRFARSSPSKRLGHRARSTIVALGVSLALAATACSASATPRLKPPASTTPPQGVTTSRPDYSTVVLPSVPGNTTTTLRMTGRATIAGFVEGPEGPVGGATVQVERLVGTAVQELRLPTNPDGTFELPGIPGGRYRVRAFLAPTLVMDRPAQFYLPDGERNDVKLTVQSFTGRTVRGSTSPTAPVLGNRVNLAVRVADRSVDENGIGLAVAVAGVRVRVESSGWTLLGATEDLTDSGGIVVFEYRCDSVGPVTAVAFVDDDPNPVGLNVPSCNPRPTTTTTTTAPAPSSSTTTA